MVLMVTFTLGLIFMNLASYGTLSCSKQRSMSPRLFGSKRIKRSSEYLNHSRVLSNGSSPSVANNLSRMNPVFYDSKLKQEDGKWYVQNGMNVDKLVVQGDMPSKSNQKNIYARGVSGVWYIFNRPPASFLSYLFKLPYRRRVYFDGKNCFVLSRTGSLEKLLKRYDKLINNKIRVFAEDGHWYNVKNLSNAFTRAVMNLPLTKIPLGQVLRTENTFEKNLLQKNGTWYISNGTSLDRIVQQGDGRGWKGMLYSRGESGKWYRFIHPPIGFRKYVESELEVCFEQARFSQVGKEWYIHHNKEYSKIVMRGAIYDSKTIYVVTGNGRWHKIINCNKTAAIIKDLITLPIAEDKFQNYRLRSTNAIKLWQIVIDNKLRNFTAYGDIIYYVRASSKHWYRIKNPPLQFKNYLDTLRWAINMAPFSELNQTEMEISHGPTFV